MREGSWGAVTDSEKSCFVCGSENEQSRHNSDVVSVCIELASLGRSSEAGVIRSSDTDESVTGRIPVSLFWWHL